MPDPKRIAVLAPDGKTRGTVPEDQLSRALDKGYSYAEEDNSPSTSTPGALSKTWDVANKGLISPETLINSLAKIAPSRQQQPNLQQLQEMSTAEPNLKEDISPAMAGVRAGLAGTAADMAKTVSGFTSPLSVATGVLSKYAAASGAAGKIARSLLTLTGMGFGAKGVKDVGEGVDKGIMTPEGAQQALSGASMVAGAAPAVGQAGRFLRSATSTILPQLSASGEGAFVSALSPDRKATPRLRAAYRTIAPELEQAPVKSLDDLALYSEVQRNQIARDTESALKAVNPQATKVDAMRVGQNIRTMVTKAMELGSPKEAQAIKDYATRVEQEFAQRPIGLGDAETMVQNLNQRTSAFDKLPYADQQRMIADGAPIAGEKAFKNSLQDQIEAKLDGYKTLKARYGSWKEVQSQTQAKIDKMESQGGNVSYLQRRSLEGLMATGGTILGMKEGGGMGGVSGAAAGYLASRFIADQILNRISNPNAALQRGLTNRTQPLPFGSQVAVQSGAEGLQQ